MSMLNIIEALTGLPKLLHDAATQLETAVAKVAEAHGVDGKIEAVASVAETAATAIQAHEDTINAVAGLAGAPGEAAAGVIEAAAPVVATVAGAIQDAYAAPIPDGTPLNKIWSHLTRIEEVASEIFGSGNGDNTAVMGALQAFKDALTAHPASAA